MIRRVAVVAVSAMVLSIAAAGCRDGEVPAQPTAAGEELAVVELPQPGSPFTADVFGLSVRDGRATVVAYAEGVGLPGERVLAWESSDGRDWRLVDPQGVSLPGGSRFLVSDSAAAGHVGLHRDRFEAGEPVAVWSSADGQTWVERSLPLELGEHDAYVVHDVVATDHSFVLLGTVWTQPSEAAAVLSGGDLTLTLSEGWWTVTDGAGRPVGEGPLTDIYPIDVAADGVAVVDPASGEVLVVIPRDVYETEQIRTGPVTTRIDHDGWRLVENDGDNTYSVVDLSSGDEVVRGASRNRLSFGADPHVVLDDGRRVSMTWEELELAWSEGLALAAASPVVERMVTTAFVSVDAGRWETVDIGTVDEGVTEVDVYWVVGAPGGEGLLGAGANHRFDEALGHGRTIWTTWTSSNGADWVPVEVDRHDGLYAEAVSSASDGVLVAGHDGSSRYLATSPDGRAWQVEHRVEEAHLHEWMSDVAAGDWMAAAVGGSESPRGDVAELFLRRAGAAWDRADLPADPLELQLTEVAVTAERLLVAGSTEVGDGGRAPVVLVFDRPG